MTRPSVRADWHGVLDPSQFKSGYVEGSHRLADAGRAGHWDRVFALLGSDDPWLDANRWRLGGTSWFTPLHHAAWHGAPAEVAQRLVELGGWRSLPDSAGRRPVDVALARGHQHLAEVLETPTMTARQHRRHAAWDRLLDALISERTTPLGPIDRRTLPTQIIVAEGLDSLWFAYPGMYGGFSMSVRKHRLVVESWCRVAGGSGQRHEITEAGCTLVAEGFV